MLSLPCIAVLKEGVCLTLLPVSLFTIISDSLSTGIFLTRTNVKAVFCSEDTAGRKDQWKLQLAFLWKSPEKVITLIFLSTYLLSNQNITNSVSGRQLKFSFKLFPLRFVIGLVVAPWSLVTASCTSATNNIIICTHLLLPAALAISASKSSIRRFVITEKAPNRAFSWLKAATTAFTFKTLLRHYANQPVRP